MARKRRGSYGFPPYVTVAEKKQQAAYKVIQLKKKGTNVEPVIIEGKAIAYTFWGKAWCKNLETYSDYDNRLPRGRSYLRSGAVIDLKTTKGEITALVMGSSIYKVNIIFSAVVPDKWQTIVQKCIGKIDSLIELLQGQFSQSVMEIMTDTKNGLFPHPHEIKLHCTCPDWADMCKHVAAVLYGIGARLDDHPEELFLLRQVDHLELIAHIGITSLAPVEIDQNETIEDHELSSLFGIDIADDTLKKFSTKKTQVQHKQDKPKIKG